ncbi:MAG: carbohydrate kinase family protein [Chloroflexia bacterium]
MNDPSLDVVVIGAAGVDTNIFLAGGDVDFSVEANFAQNLDYVGGAGGYSSRGFARLCKRTAFIGYVGDDHNGRFLAGELAASGIETTLFIDPAGTRRSVNIMYRDGRRKNFYDGRGAMHVRADPQACKHVMSRAHLAHFTIENWTRHLLAPAKELGLIISCDLQDVVSPDDPYRADYVAQADILFFSSTNFSDPSDLIAGFLDAGPARVVVAGMGNRGCALGTRHAGVRFFDPVSLEEPVIDTNGAGDGLAAGFLSSYCLDGYSLEDSILRGQIVARYTCTQKADSSHLISMAQLDEYFLRMRST